MTEIHDATPDWARLEWANLEIVRLRSEVDRRDVLLRWIAENMPRTLELCPYKLGELRETSNREKQDRVMDGQQLDAYYDEQLAMLHEAIIDLDGINWDGLHHWLSAKTTWTTPPMRPDRLAVIREAAVTLVGVSNTDSIPKEDT